MTVGLLISVLVLVEWSVCTHAGAAEGMCDRSLDALCIRPNSTSNVVCSGRGDCVCGVCDCHPRRAHSLQRYSGSYCDCDDYSCSYAYNQLCGGHGECKCGVCICDDGYTGESCECPTSNETCRTSAGLLCNGVGECLCGRCKCFSDSSYRGPTCEECPTCPGKCSENKNCVLCMAFHTGPYSAEECNLKCEHVLLVDIIDEEEVKHNKDMHLCQFNDEMDDCRYFFTYEYPENYQNIKVRVQKTKLCPGSNTAGPGSMASMNLGSIRVLVFFGAIVLFI